MKKIFEKNLGACAKVAAICIVLLAAVLMNIGIKTETAMAKENLENESKASEVRRGMLKTTGEETFKKNKLLNLNARVPSLKNLNAETDLNDMSLKNRLKAATYVADGVNLQMGIHTSAAKTNDLSNMVSAYDTVYSGYPVIRPGNEIFLNAASPTSDSIKVIAYLVTVTNQKGEQVYEAFDTVTDDPDYNNDNWYLHWYHSVSAVMQNSSEGIWTYSAAILCMDETIYAGDISFAVLNERVDQTIYVDSSFTKTYGTGGFSLGAISDGGGTLSYKSSNTNVVSVSDNGWVNIKGYGTAKITVTAAETYTHWSASETVSVKIIPDKVKITKLTSPSKKKIVCVWSRVAAVTGYEMRLSGAGKNFVITTKKNSAKGSGKSKKKYSVKVRAYKTVGSTKYYGSWSSAKTVKVK